MMITDTIDSMIVYKMVNQSGKLGQAASRLMGWVIVFLAYGVSFYLAFTFFNHWAELDFEMVGIILFIFLVSSFIFVSVRSKRQNVEINTTN
jgi:nickel/cobalt transporter (NiCoT) family protein